MIRPQSTSKAQMKTILMLIVGLMLAGCGSMENHVRNRDAVDRNRYLVEHNAVDTICACPWRLNHMAWLNLPAHAQDAFLIAVWRMIRPWCHRQFMALIKCSECGKDVSDKATACPNCGAPIGSEHGPQRRCNTPVRVVRAGWRWEAIGALLVIGGLIAGMAGAGSGWFVPIVGFVIFIIGRVIGWLPDGPSDQPCWYCQR
jgi:hypothetical protein